LVICQIESLQAVENIDAICAQDGIDMFFIGPLDLSASAGCMGDYKNPTFVKALERAETTIRDSDKWLGGLVMPGDSTADMFKRGYNLVMPGSDVFLLREAALENLKAAL
ncbi:MAG: hypothetical protein JKY27_11095, partial [Magnetovibrio sp.]|nr:hypothetical protein [Magnetovibrio sp.]